jgi:dCTP deaminase
MSILSGRAIKQAIKYGEIEISDFDESRLNPHSYNLRLGNTFLQYDEHALDSEEEAECNLSYIPAAGVTLYPGQLYLMHTMETVCAHSLVPIIDGRSSVGRLGIGVHITAGYGDVGFKGTYTLEVTVVKPVVVYAGSEICQIRFQTLELASDEWEYPKYNGKYNGQTGPKPSGWWKESIKWH